MHPIFFKLLSFQTQTLCSSWPGYTIASLCLVHSHCASFANIAFLAQKSLMPSFPVFQGLLPPQILAGPFSSGDLSQLNVQNLLSLTTELTTYIAQQAGGILKVQNKEILRQLNRRGRKRSTYHNIFLSSFPLYHCPSTFQWRGEEVGEKKVKEENWMN